MSPRPSAGLVTLADVAAHAGVSVATASRALNGSSRIVNLEMRERVLASSVELGYSANAQAQAVARGSTRTVAIVLGDINDPYFSAIASGVIEEADKNDLVVTMWTTGSRPERLLSTLVAMRSQRPQALIIAQSSQVEPELDDPINRELVRLQRAGTTVCAIGAGSGDFLRILVDNRGASFRLALALIDLGYKRFLVLSGSSHLRAPVERTEGFVAGLQSAGLVPVGILEGTFSRVGAIETMAAALGAGIRADCVFAVTDVMALGVVAALRDNGLEPGRDIGVAGFGDIQTVRYVSPALTTVAIRLAELGSEALRATLGAEEKGAHEPAAGSVILRESTPAR